MVYFCVQLRGLALGLFAIHLAAGFRACKRYQTYNKALAGQHSVGPHCVLQSKRFTLSVKFEETREVVYVGGWLFTVDCCFSKINNLVQVLHATLNEVDWLSKFPVRFPVELVCPDENRTSLFGSVKQYQVGWHSLVS